MEDRAFHQHLQKMLEKDRRDQGLTTMEVIRRDQREQKRKKGNEGKKHPSHNGSGNDSVHPNKLR